MKGGNSKSKNKEKDRMITDCTAKKDRLSLRQTVELRSTQLPREPPLPRKNSEKLTTVKRLTTNNTRSGANLFGSAAMSARNDATLR